MKSHQRFSLRHLTELQAICFICCRGELWLRSLKPHPLLLSTAFSKICYRYLPNCGLLEANLSGCVDVYPKKWFFLQRMLHKNPEHHFCIYSVLDSIVLGTFLTIWGGEGLKGVEYLCFKPLCKKGYALMQNEFTPVSREAKGMFAFSERNGCSRKRRSS